MYAKPNQTKGLEQKKIINGARSTVIPRLTLPRLALIRYNAVQLPYIALHCYIVYEGIFGT
ncbi:hypothetical protein DERF_016718 [Dermatophagoides farinae]|uniref:Uncharacterized protein n=1 Tax=Dermatophagoides farinae TaxID=6954 RepID=A0A922HMP2_DERFA|nr:hypothetical protein DERF_016718 [Dermatophagoides farinae]